MKHVRSRLVRANRMDTVGLWVAYGACCTGVANEAGADFTGWSVERITLSSGHTIMNVYANFSNTGDRVLSVYDAEISTNITDGFFQSGANEWWAPGTQNMLTSDDSWVCIGTNPSGSGNASGSITSGGPNFVNFNDANESTDFSFIESSGTGAGWYNTNPGNTWGYANLGGNRVLVAHFVAVNATNAAQVVSWNATLLVTGHLDGVGAGQNIFPWVPSNAEDPDEDSDGVPDDVDNCPAISNPSQADCNGDGIGDDCAIGAGASDVNHDAIPDICQCLADLFVDGNVDGGDLGVLLIQWGAAPPGTAGDINRSGAVDGEDLGLLLHKWGPCPN